MNEKAPTDLPDVPACAPWDNMQFFLAIAQSGGLSAAGRLTGKSPATLGRRMRQLERELGRDLFHRHDQGYSLTSDGEALFAELSDIGARLDRLRQRTVREDMPLVKISAGSWRTLTLLDRYADIAGHPPDVRLRFVQDEKFSDLNHREVTLAIRNTRPSAPGLAARKLARAEFAGFARADAPSAWIQVLVETPSARWVRAHAGGRVACEVTAPRNALDLARAGVGRALLPTFIGDHLRGLERVTDPIEALSHDQWLVMQDDERHLPEVRRVIERLYKMLK